MAGAVIVESSSPFQASFHSSEQLPATGRDFAVKNQMRGLPDVLVNFWEIRERLDVAFFLRVSILSLI